MIAFKWLAAGAISPFTGHAWRPGTWVRAPEGAAEGLGIHACRVAQLPYWICDELWRVELAGTVRERETQVEAERARLVERLTRWDPSAFADACRARIAAFGAESPSQELRDYAAAAEHAGPAEASYIAAVAAVAARAGDRRAFEDERAWQAQWLARALDLHDG
jgi:hypothetical protein